MTVNHVEVIIEILIVTNDWILGSNEACGKKQIVGTLGDWVEGQLHKK